MVGASHIDLSLTAEDHAFSFCLAPTAPSKSSPGFYISQTSQPSASLLKYAQCWEALYSFIIRLDNSIQEKILGLRVISFSSWS